MNTITASSFASILEHDPLYSDKSIALKVSNHLALKNNILIHFFGYLYGSKFDVVRSNFPSVKHKDILKENDSAGGHVACNFVPISRKFMREFYNLSSEVSDIDNDDALLQKEFSKYSNIVWEAMRENNIYIHLVTIFLATGMKFLHHDVINVFNVLKFEKFIRELYGEILQEAFRNIVLTEDYIYNFFVVNMLPLPMALYPVEMYNTDSFMQNFSFGAWGNCDPIKSFKFFYDPPVKAKSQCLQDTHEVHCLNPAQAKQKQSEKDFFQKPDESRVEYAFYKCGDFWEVIYKGRRSSVKDVAGLKYIHYIIAAGERGVTIDELNALKEPSKEACDAKFFDGDNKLNEDRKVKPFKGASKIRREKIQEVIEGIEDKIEDVKRQKAAGCLSMEDSIDEVARLEKQKKAVYEATAPDADKNYKRVYDRITKSINAARRNIEKHDKQLYVHLMQACTPKHGTFYYIGQASVDWKLFEK